MTLMLTRPRKGDPAWDLATLYPGQGYWSDAEYLALTHDTNRLIELSDGYIEVLPMPNVPHQRIVAMLYKLLFAFVSARDLGEVLFAPLRVRLRAGKFREPDVVFMLRRNVTRIGEEYWDGADLVMEVVSDDPKGRRRDTRDKVKDYAEAGIREYWIIDPKKRQIRVMKLSGKRYVPHGEFGAGERAGSALLKGFEVEVDAVLGIDR